MTNKIKALFIIFFVGVLSLVLSMFFVDVFFRGLLILSFLAFVLLSAYSIMEYVMVKENDDLWKLGFLGVFGLLPLIPGVSVSFFALFGLFVFFGLKD
ncbi:MAG: hypothetical protein PHX92_02210 [Candidatus Pacebacteria bacterium]|nr:hypothetical protein [Candidatus Paceibacterota bacterium]